MKHELQAILSKYGKMIASSSVDVDFYEELVGFCKRLPDDADIPCSGGVSTTDLKYAKMQTVHQLLVNTVSRPTETTEKAIELARMVDAAFAAIDAPIQEKPVASPVSDDGNLGDFADAIIWLQGGKKVARESWREGWSISLNKGQTDISLFVPGAKGGSKSWIGEANELLANDWRVVS